MNNKQEFKKLDFKVKDEIEDRSNIIFLKSVVTFIVFCFEFCIIGDFIKDFVLTENLFVEIVVLTGIFIFLLISLLEETPMLSEYRIDRKNKKSEKVLEYCQDVTKKNKSEIDQRNLEVLDIVEEINQKERDVCYEMVLQLKEKINQGFFQEIQDSKYNLLKNAFFDNIEKYRGDILKRSYDCVEFNYKTFFSKDYYENRDVIYNQFRKTYVKYKEI